MGKSSDLLEEMLKNARSIESAGRTDVEYVGLVPKGSVAYRIYTDTDGNTWYKKYFIDQITGEIIPEEEKIFGRRVTRRYA